MPYFRVVTEHPPAVIYAGESPVEFAFGHVLSFVGRFGIEPVAGVGLKLDQGENTEPLWRLDPHDKQFAQAVEGARLTFGKPDLFH